jgi:hypothetical protein
MVKASTERPNVIVFFTDQQRGDTSGLYGNPLDLTPNFNQQNQQDYFPAPDGYQERSWVRGFRLIWRRLAARRTNTLQAIMGRSSG